MGSSLITAGLRNLTYAYWGVMLVPRFGWIELCESSPE